MRDSFIGSIIGDCLKKNKTQELTTSDKIDRIVTNRWLALPIFAAVMWLVYYVSVTTVGSILTDWTNDTLFGEWIIPAAQSFFEGIGCADWLTGLIVDGVISGVVLYLDSYLRCLYYLFSLHSLSLADTWHVSHSSWTVFSVSSDFPENHLSRC